MAGQLPHCFASLIFVILLGSSVPLTSHSYSQTISQQEEKNEEELLSDILEGNRLLNCFWFSSYTKDLGLKFDEARLGNQNRYLELAEERLKSIPLLHSKLGPVLTKLQFFEKKSVPPVVKLYFWAWDRTRSTEYNLGQVFAIRRTKHESDYGLFTDVTGYYQSDLFDTISTSMLKKYECESDLKEQSQ